MASVKRAGDHGVPIRTMSEPGPILFLSTSLVRAGAETQLTRLAIELKHRGWSVHVVSMLEPEAFTGEFDQAGVPWTTLQMPRGIPDPRGLLRLTSLLRRHRPAMLVTFMVHANLLGRIAARLSGVPSVVSSIRTEKFGGWRRDLLMRLTDGWTDATVVNSRLSARGVVERGVTREEKVEVIPNAIPAADYRPDSATRSEMRRRLGVGDEDFLWLGVGRLHPQKNFTLLVEAFQRVAAERPDSRLMIAGRGPLREELLSLIDDLNLRDTVRLLGFRDDVPRLLAAADAFVMSSRTEGMPNAVMEAMAAGLPVVATAVAGIPELVEDGVTGRLVRAESVTALSQEMLELMETPAEERRRMGDEAAAIIQSEYSVSTVVDRWENLFGRLGVAPDDGESRLLDAHADGERIQQDRKGSDTR